MARGKKRSEPGVKVTVTRMKKAKTMNTKYRSRKSISTKISENGRTRTVTMPYSAKSTARIASDTVASLVLNANDIFTTQPMGRDQMFALFDKAYVKRSALMVRFCPGNNEAAAGNGLYTMNVWADTNSAASGSTAESIQRCYAHNGKSVARHVMVIADGSGCSITTPMEVNIEDYTKHVTGHGFESDELSQLVTAAPENKWYWHIERYSNTGEAVTGTANSVTDYVMQSETLFYDPKELAVS